MHGKWPGRRDAVDLRAVHRCRGIQARGSVGERAMASVNVLRKGILVRQGARRGPAR